MGEIVFKMIKREERNYSLDLLRIISIFLVICCHINSHGGYAERFIFPEFMWVYTKFFSSLAIICVNVFVIISGYLKCESEKFHLSRIVRIYTASVFISEICYFIYLSYTSTDFSIVLFIQNIFFGDMWFVSQYIALYLLSPFLNKFIKAINKRQHLVVMILLYFMGGLTKDLCRYTWVNFNNGYSLMWFIELYLIGAFIKKYHTSYPPLYSTLVYLLCSVMLTLSSVIFELNKLPVLRDIYPADHFYRYNSILVLISSISFFMIFVKIKHVRNIKLIRFITPAVLGIYVLHDNIYMREMIWTGNIYLKITNSVDGAAHILIMLVVVIIIFTLCLMIEKIRIIFSNLIFKSKIVSDLLLKLDNKWNEIIK